MSTAENNNNTSPIARVDLWGEPLPEPSRGALADKFTMPPFTVLDARSGEWQNRKRAWIGLGIKSEIGRGENALSLAQGEQGSGTTLDYIGAGKDTRAYAKVFGIGDKAKWDAEKQRKAEGDNPGQVHNLNCARRYARGAVSRKATPGGNHRPACDYSKNERGAGDGRAIPGGGTEHVSAVLARTATGYEAGEEAQAAGSGTSIFDPVLTECLYQWFCPPGGQILDPFAGGSVRGVVAATLGYRYWGCELRAEQVFANCQQAEKICPAEYGEQKLRWHNGRFRHGAKAIRARG